MTFALATVALDRLKAAAKLDPRLWFAIAVVTPALANVPGMGDAKANWNGLAKDLEVKYPNMVGNAVFLSRGNWIAEDAEAFLHATAVFSGELQRLSGICYNVEGQLDKVRGAYYDYWLGVVKIAGVALLFALTTSALRLTPWGLKAQELMTKLAITEQVLLAKMTGLLLTHLQLSGDTLVTLLKSMGDLFNIKPTGGLKIDFQQAVIDTKPPSQWVAPKRDIPAPYQAPPATT
ncbi:hypothetical protein ACFQVD_40050 [Streptosporangium amethystogenes subsp. fukuiense]|uniref:Uncharacterized protein n=1 Tax=Streptosporangium amethystogenes subsp. fukuiense TaxID=698418 RepID=A0ABW2TCP8_9ACTN